MNRLQADAMSLALIAHDVALLSDDALSYPTPCDGWTVADLVRHMNEQHEQIIGPVLGPFGAADEDPRSDFALIAARWIAAVQADDDIEVPKVRKRLPVGSVIDIHLVDMLVHRWDLARAQHLTAHVPDVLADLALPIARSITQPGSPLTGPDGVYDAPRAEAPASPAIDNLAALLGRDPQWSPTPHI